MKTKRITGVLLVICMIFGMTPTVVNGAVVIPQETKQEMPVLGENVNTADAATVYLNVADRGLNYGPLEFRVIGYDGEGVASTKGTVTLYASNVIDRDYYYFSHTAYDESGKSNAYGTSTLKAKFDNIKLEPEVSDAVVGRTLDGNGNNGSESLIKGSTVNNAQFWPLSASEASAVDKSIRQVTYFADYEIYYSWLRTPGHDNASASYMNALGEINVDGSATDNVYGTRPAVTLDLSKIVFASPASGYGRQTGTLKKMINDNNEWNLILLDGSRQFAVTETAVTAVQGEYVNINYSGAIQSEKAVEYISAALYDKDGKVLYYGHLISKPETNGSVSFPVPYDIAAGDYTLRLYNDNISKYCASAPCDIALTVTAASDEGDPVSVSSFDELMLNTADGGFVKLTKDIGGNDLTIENKVIIDLNGFILNCGITVTSTGWLTVIDSNPTSEHTSYTYSVPSEAVFNETTRFEAKGGLILKAVKVKGGRFTMNGGTITKSNSGAVTVLSGGTFEMNGGMIAGNTGHTAHDEFENELGLWTSGYIYVSDAGSRFIMTGGTVTCNSVRDDYKNLDELQNGGYAGICICNGAVFDMEGGSITRNMANRGGGVYVDSGTFNMKGGEISVNVAGIGGGVHIYKGTFNMTGGKISGNLAYNGYGGGIALGGTASWPPSIFNESVYIKVKNVVSFNMKGGSIENNAAGQNGGGIFVNTCVLFNVTGGTITGNEAQKNGGGICIAGENTLDYPVAAAYADMGLEVADDTYVLRPIVVANMRDCTVSGNRAAGNGGGICLYNIYSEIQEVKGKSQDDTTERYIYPSESFFAVSGKLVVTGNKNGAGKKNNLDLRQDTLIYVTGDLYGSDIGVTTQERPERSSPVVFTKGLYGNGKATHFESDDSRYGVKTYNDEAALGYFNYKIINRVSGDGKAEIYVENISPDNLYNGSEFSADKMIYVVIKPNTGYSLKNISVSYGEKELTLRKVDGADNTYCFTMPSADVTVNASFVELYPLWVGGVQVNANNKDDITAAIVASGGTATGTATYDPKNNVLTLENFTYSGEGYKNDYLHNYSAFYYTGNSKLDIKLIGNNSITQTGVDKANSSYGMNVNPSESTAEVQITSDCGGKLTVKGGTVEEGDSNYGGISTGIYLQNVDLVVFGADVTAESGEGTKYTYGVFVSDGSLTLESGSLTAKAGKARQFGSTGIYYAGDELTVNGGTLIAQGNTRALEITKLKLADGIAAKASTSFDGENSVVYKESDNNDYKWVKIYKAQKFTVTVTPGENMAKTTDSGAASQTVTEEGAITSLVYTVSGDYYFPADYAVNAVNGISVTRNSYTQITVSGTPTDNAEIKLTAPTAKTKENTPNATFTATGADMGTLSNLVSGMKYKIDDGEWVAVTATGVDLTGLKACTITVYKLGNGTTTTNSDVQTITVTKAETPALTATQPATVNDKGSIPTTSSYEKSTDGKTWTACSGALTDLDEGTYYVRVKAAGTALTSEAQEIKIAVAKYTVKFADENGVELQSTVYKCGETPVYTGEEPKKENTAQYTYKYEGWDKEIVPVTSDTTYKAKFSYTVNEYTVKFVNGDGTLLQESKVKYGDIPEYKGETPTLPATAEKTYTFDCWSSEFTAVKGDATYKAFYTETINEYTVKFVNDDGAVLQESKLAYGQTPAYKGDVPKKEATAEKTYTFDGWDKEPVTVTCDATYKAKYTDKTNVYTVRFINDNGSELQSGAVEYGVMPKYTGDVPKKEATAAKTFEFKGWDKEIETVKGEATYTATYTEKAREYTVAFFDTLDNQPLRNIKVKYGETINSSDIPNIYGMDFCGWFNDYNATVEADFTKPITGNTCFYTGYDGFIYNIKGKLTWYGNGQKNIELKITRSRNDDAAYGLFTGQIFLDGQAVSSENFKAEPGCVQITIYGEVFEDLPNGEHELVIMFEDAEVKTTITVDQTAESPQTADMNVGLWLIATAAGLSGTVLIYCAGRKKRLAAK